jgi:hypothetical protein
MRLPRLGRDSDLRGQLGCDVVEEREHVFHHDVTFIARAVVGRFRVGVHARSVAWFKHSPTIVSAARRPDS